MISLKIAGPGDTGTIRDIAYCTWPVAYAEILSPEQLKYMLELFYSQEALTKQLVQQGHRFIILYEEGNAAGFASFSEKNKEAPSMWRLHKLYVLPDQQGKGFGQTLLKQLTMIVSSEGGTSIELNVNRRNKALHFYTQAGFVISGEEDIDIGNGYFMNDFVMVKQLQ